MPKINKDISDVIFRMKQCNQTWRSISDAVGLSINTIRSFYRRKTAVMDLPNKEKIKKKLISARFGQLIKTKIKDQPNISIRKLLKWLKDDHGFTGSRWAVHTFLKENGYVSRIAKKVFAISKKNQQKRIEIAEQMINRPAEYFRNVIWSDETSVKSRPDYRQLRYFSRSELQNDRSFVNRQVCAGGFSVMFWGCISYQAMGPLVEIQGKIDRSKYIEIITDALLPEIAHYSGEILFQQDHAPPHKAKQTLDFLHDRGVRLFPHPPQSPDLNPIERVWAIMKQKLYDDFPIPTSRDQLIDSMFQIWRDFPMETVRKLIDGMPQRYMKVLDANGLWIE